MKKVLAGIICALVICASATMGYLFCKNTEDDTSMYYAAKTLVKSFGWNITPESTEKYNISEETFYKQYYHTTGESPSDPIDRQTSGNISGIEPEILNREYFISQDQNVSVYQFPLEYDMPEGCELIATIAFFEDEICMSSVQLQFDDVDSFIIKVESLDEGTRALLLPSIWPLNVEKQVIEEWKTNYVQFINPV